MVSLAGLLGRAIEPADVAPAFRAAFAAAFGVDLAEDPGLEVGPAAARPAEATAVRP
jgi:hypothetical protein